MTGADTGSCRRIIAEGAACFIVRVARSTLIRQVAAVETAVRIADLVKMRVRTGAGWSMTCLADTFAEMVLKLINAHYIDLKKVNLIIQQK